MKKVVCVDTRGYNNLQLGKVYKTKEAVGNHIILEGMGLYLAGHFRLVDNFNYPVRDPSALSVGEMVYDPKQLAFWVVRSFDSLEGGVVVKRRPQYGPTEELRLSRNDFYKTAYFTCFGEEIFTPNKVEIEVLY